MHAGGSVKVNDALTLEIGLLRRNMPRKLQHVSFESQIAPLLDAVQAPIDALAARIDSVTQDPDLSANGKAKQLRVARLDSLAKLATFEANELAGQKGLAGIIVDFERQVDAAANSKLSRPKDATERLILEVRTAEIRRTIPADPLMRDLLYMGATDPEVIASFESAPTSFIPDGQGGLREAPFVSPDVRKERMLTRAHELAPSDTVAGLKELYYVRDTVEGLVATARTAIDEAISPELQTYV